MAARNCSALSNSWFSTYTRLPRWRECVPWEEKKHIGGWNKAGKRQTFSLLFLWQYSKENSKASSNFFDLLNSSCSKKNEALQNVSEYAIQNRMELLLKQRWRLFPDWNNFNVAKVGKYETRRVARGLITMYVIY